MATHKVPQNVEADDKLLGPLSLKQLIFVILGLAFGYLTFVFFSQIHPVTGIIPLPFAIVFLVLGGYRRSDQPVEIFLMSALRFYLKPRKRKWDQEGYEERVKITAPPKIEHHYTKSFTGEEAVGRLTNLSRMMDSRGWASKIASDWQNPQLATAAAAETDRLVTTQDVANVQAFDPQHYVQPADVMDDSSSIVSQQFASKIQQVDSNTRQQAIQTLQQARQLAPTPDTNQQPIVQKYPAMHQKVLNPASDQPAAPPNVTSQATQAPATTTTTSQTPPTPPPTKTDSSDEVKVSLH